VIRSNGYDVVPQVGVSGFRIDLGVIDPIQPGRFVLGVECDGARITALARHAIATGSVMRFSLASAGACIASGAPIGSEIHSARSRASLQ
jgi:hypothetical protein